MTNKKKSSPALVALARKAGKASAEKRLKNLSASERKAIGQRLAAARYGHTKPPAPSMKRPLWIWNGEEHASGTEVRIALAKRVGNLLASSGLDVIERLNADGTSTVIGVEIIGFVLNEGKTA